MSVTMKERLGVFCDMALQLRRDAVTEEDQRLVGDVLIEMWYGGRGMGRNSTHSTMLSEEAFARRLHVAIHGTLGEKIAATGAVHRMDLGVGVQDVVP